MSLMTCKISPLTILMKVPTPYTLVMDLPTGTVLLSGPCVDGVYSWPLSVSPQALTVKSSSAGSSWHHKLGHPSESILKFLQSSFQLGHFVSSDSCPSCSIHKSHKLPFHKSSISSTFPLEVIFSDVWSSSVPSYDGFRYYIIFVDHFTRYIWFYPLRNKSDTKEVFIKFKALVENYFQTKIKILYSDNGGEYIALASFLATHGISHLTSPPHTPQHNGFSERRHRHIVETGLSLMSFSGLPQNLWPFAFKTAVYLINRMPTPTLQNSSPYHSLFQVHPNYQKLKSFGCLCFPWLKPYTTNKLEPKSTPCVFVGYSLSQSAYFCLDPDTYRVYTSRHVTFVEHVYPFQSPSPSVSPSTHGTPSPSTDGSAWATLSIPLQPDPAPTEPLPPDGMPPPSPATPHPIPNPNSPLPLSPHPIPNPNSSPSPGFSNATPNVPNSPHITSSISPASTSNQLASASTQSSDSNPEPEPVPAHHGMTTRSQNNIFKPIHKLNLHVQALTSREPANITQALKDPDWRHAMAQEYEALCRNETWDLVPSDLASNVVGCKWVFRVKYMPDGSLDKYKARLVAKGFHQRPGCDFTETFIPVIKPVTVRTVLTLAVSSGWPLRQIDVNNAFLQGHLSEDVFMEQPPGFLDKAFPHHVCKLKKAIYGLKQAPRAWYTELRDFLLQVGFVNSVADSSLFIYRRHRLVLYLLVYVDDIIVTGNDSVALAGMIQRLSTRFSLKDLGSLAYFLGVEVHMHPKGLFLNQHKYIMDLLQRMNMADANPISTPMCSTSSLQKTSGTILDSPTNFRAAIGTLQYLSLTRPDISFAVNKLSQFMHEPSTAHWSALKRLLRYLQGTSSHGIIIHRQLPLSLHGFTDADWAGDKDDYTSTTGYLMYLGSTPISWSSRKQKSVARSSTEAEYRALADSCAELVWITSLLAKLGVHLPRQPVLYCDNLGAKSLSANPVFHSRMKHIALAFHFVRELVQKGLLRVAYVSTDDQLADVLTKPLPRPKFQILVPKLGLSVPTSSLRGHVKDN